MIAVPKTLSQANCCPPTAAIECFWLCDECASLFTLVVEPGAGVVCVPKLPVLATEPKVAKPNWLRSSKESLAESIKVAS